MFLKRILEEKNKKSPHILDEKTFLGLVNRITNGQYTDKIKINKKESRGGFDEYELFVKNGLISIKATSGVAAAVALNAYLKKYCHYMYGPKTVSGNLPAIPPDTEMPMAEESVFVYRYALNFCTFGYSYGFSGWNELERLTDYLLLSGYNLILNPIANECVWVELLKRFGYTTQEAKAYISAPNYLPWQWMMNLSAFDGLTFDSWYCEQLELSKLYSRKLKSFGVGIVYPGYCGAVPDDFSTRYPSVEILSQGNWGVYVRPSILLPTSDGLFEKIAHDYYAIQRELFEDDSICYFSIDPFHEGGNKGKIDLRNYAQSVLKAMKQANANAVWVFQGWLDNPDRELISALSQSDVLVLNLQADRSPDGGDNFLKYPHVYCVVNNFGGQQRFAGSAYKTYTRAFELAKSNEFSCVGIGILPEGIECDEMLFDIIAEISIRKKLRSVDEYLSEYVEARYGLFDPSLFSAAKLLFENIYLSDNIRNCLESGLLSLPSLDVHNVSFWSGTANVNDNAKMNVYLRQIAEKLMKNYDVCKNRKGYIFDLVATLRQMIANKSWEYVYGINDAFQKKDIQLLEENADALFSLFDLQKKVVACDENLNLQRYLDEALARGHNEDEKRYYYRNAMRLILTWCSTENEINDYAAREYADLLEQFYKPRWEKYVNVLKRAIENGEEDFDCHFLEDGIEIENRYVEYGRSVSENLYEIAKEVLSKKI